MQLVLVWGRFLDPQWSLALNRQDEQREMLIEQITRIIPKYKCTKILKGLILDSERPKAISRCC